MAEASGSIVKQASVPLEAAPPRPLDSGSHESVWKKALAMAAGQRTLAGLVAQLEPPRIEAGSATLRASPGLRMLLEPRRAELEKLLSAASGCRLTLELIDASAELTAEAVAQRVGVVKDGADAVASGESIESNPLVKAAMETFDATIVNVTPKRREQ